MATNNDMPPTVDLLLTTQQIPDLDALQMSALLQYMFQHAPRTLRIRVAEVVFRFNRAHPRGFDLFLASVLPLAERTARRKAEQFPTGHSEWRFEAMYDGAVNAAIELFQRREMQNRNSDDAFRRLLLRALAFGTSRYFAREENTAIRTVSDFPVVQVRNCPWRHRLALNTVEDRIISRQLLEQVTRYQNLPDGARAVLSCIRTLGPDLALKEHAFTNSGDPDKWKRERGRRSILDPDAIAEAMNTDRATVHYHLARARVYLRKTFNSDGRLFQRR